VGDYYETAGQDLDQNKAALLAAIAQHGSQAGAAMQQAKDEIARQRAAAIQAALGEAAHFGGAPNQTADVEQRIGAPYDRRLADLGSADASRQASFGDLSSSAGTYMDEAKASLPALRTQLAEKVAGLQAQVSQAQIRAQQDAEDRALQREKLMADIANSRAAASKPPGVDDILRETFGGLTGFQDLVESAAPQLRSLQNSQYAGERSQLRSIGNATARGEANLTVDPGLLPDEVANRIGQTAGLGAGQGSALYAPRVAQRAKEDDAAMRRDRQDASSSSGIRNSSEYQSATADFINGVRAQVAPEDIMQRLTEEYGAAVAQQVLSDNGRLLP
jgi:hypothetical protein